MSEANAPQRPKAGHFSWNELVTGDAKASADFYGQLFGWQAVPFVVKGAPAGGPPYTLFKTDPNDMGRGGMVPAPHPGAPAQWVPYVVVENADAALAKASALGAKVLLPVMAVGEVGRIAVVQDPLGATIGLHELAKECPD